MRSDTFNMSDPYTTPSPVPTVDEFHMRDDDFSSSTAHAINALVLERQFLSVAILALAFATLAIFGMIGMLALQIKRLAEMLRNARAVAAASALPDAKTGLLSNQVSGKLAAKKPKKITFEDTSCAGPRDLDEEEI